MSAACEEAGLVTSTGRTAEVRPVACGVNMLRVRVGDAKCASDLVAGVF